MPERPAQPPTGPADWPAQAADTIVRVVGDVREATTDKAIVAARGLVYGLLAGLLGAAVAVLLAIAAVRVIVVLLPDDSVWAAHLIVGSVFTVVGMLLWRQRKPRAAEA